MCMVRMYYRTARCFLAVGAHQQRASKTCDKVLKAGTSLRNSLSNRRLQSRKGRTPMTNNNPVGWFEIYVQDMSRARQFYDSVFQVKLEKLDSPGIEMWSFPMVMGGSGAAGALVKFEGVSPGGNSTLVYFHCADCAVEAGRISAAGGRVHREKMSIGKWGFIALALDSEGNMFGLHSMK